MILKRLGVNTNSLASTDFSYVIHLKSLTGERAQTTWLVLPTEANWTQRNKFLYVPPSALKIYIWVNLWKGMWGDYGSCKPSISCYSTLYVSLLCLVTSISLCRAHHCGCGSKNPIHSLHSGFDHYVIIIQSRLAMSYASVRHMYIAPVWHEVVWHHLRNRIYLQCWGNEMTLIGGDDC